MVNIIENKAQVEGMVISIKPDPLKKDFNQILFDLKVARDVNPFPNLAKADEGKIIRINFPKNENASIKPVIGESLNILIRKNYGQVYFITT